LLDAIWPREKMSFRGIFQEIVRLAHRGADAIFFRSRPGLDYREYSPWILARRLETPRAFVIVKKGAPPLALDLLDYDDSDDSAWSFRWTGARGRSDLFPSHSGGLLSRSDLPL
jgi:hypothetical protein